jgi:hypothetical protein
MASFDPRPVRLRLHNLIFWRSHVHYDLIFWVATAGRCRNGELRVRVSCYGAALAVERGFRT